MKGFGALLRPLEGKIAVSCLIGLVRISASMAFVWICKALVDIATGQSERQLSTFIWIMLGIMLIRLISNIAASYWEGYIIVNAQNDTRKRLFAHVMQSKWNGQEAFHSADTVNRLEEDIRVIADLLCSRLPECIITVCQLIAASVYLFILSPSLLWVLLILMPVAVIGSKMFFKTIRSLTEHLRAKESEIQGHMQENLQNRVIIKTLGCIDAVMEKMGWLQEDARDTTIKRLNYNAIARGFMSFGFTAGYAAAFLWGVVGIKNGAVTYGMMTAFLQLVGQVQRPIADISRHIPAFIHALTSESRLLELEDQPLEEDGSSIKIEGAPGIRVENLTFAYEGQTEPVFKAFSHDFTPGSTTAIMGLTGAGKSTLTRLMMALLEPSEGSISLYTDKGECYTSDVRTRCNFMYVPQGNSLMSGTIRTNLLLARPDASEEMMKEALHLAAADFVTDLPAGLDTVCTEKGSGLSEGQAQRIAIARALLHDGGIIILDEASSALDSETETMLLERLDKHFSGRKTIIWITHRDSITKFAGTILKL